MMLLDFLQEFPRIDIIESFDFVNENWYIFFQSDCTVGSIFGEGKGRNAVLFKKGNSFLGRALH
jgi:hypothetical protein